MALTQERRGQIALVALRHRLNSNGIKIHKNLAREIGSKLKELNEFDENLNLTPAEASQFAEELMMEIVNRTFQGIREMVGKKS